MHELIYITENPLGVATQVVVLVDSWTEHCDVENCPCGGVLEMMSFLNEDGMPIIMDSASVLSYKALN